MKRLTYEYVKTFIENVDGYSLISTEYKNVITKLLLKCPEGHVFEMIFDSFRNGRRCPICFGTHKYSYEYIKNTIEKEGYKLLSENYINVDTKLSVLCDKGHMTEITYSHFRDGHRCKYCAGNTKYEYGYVKETIEKCNYTLLSKKYVNKKTKLDICCDKGHTFKMTFGHFNNGTRCPECWRESRRSLFEDDIKYAEFNMYKKLIRRYTNKLYKENKNKINPLNKQIGRYKYHLDHKYSIYQGFLDKIDPKIISSINNLEVLSEYENCSKGISCSITKEELLSEYFGKKGGID